MKRSILSAATVLLLAMPLSCEKEKVPDPAPAATAAPPPKVAPAPTAAATPPAEVENIPVAADFEEEAEKTITKANYKAELDTLEAELKR